jgi:YegS/Rv2252/BmrU family lipid kinase
LDYQRQESSITFIKNTTMNKQINLNDKKIALIVNGKSQRGRSLFRHAKTLLIDNGIKLDQSLCIRKPREIKQNVKDIITSGIDMIIIGGGDGTISEIVDFGVKEDILFAILPFGTSNSFARSLNLPLNLESAVKVIKSGNVKQIDLGQIGDDYFANTANVGLSVEVNRSVNNDFKRNFGRLAYLPLAIWNLLTFQPFDVTITSPIGVSKFKCIEILIANGQFQGGIPLALNANLGSGKLILKMFLCNNWKDKLNLLGYWFLSLFRHNIRNRRIKQFGFDQLKIETREPMYVDIDGEASIKTPIDVSVAEGVLSIIAP